MNAIRLPYWKLLVQKASQRTQITRQGNSIYDNLATSRNSHSNIQNLVWWDNPSLKCYTPIVRYHGVHCVMDGAQQTDTAGNTVTYSDPTLASFYPKLTWTRVSGTALARTVVPAGPVAVGYLKLLPPPDGSPWAYQTSQLPTGWAGGLNASTGALPENGSVSIQIRLGKGDQASTATTMAIDSDGYDPNPVPPASSQPRFVRVMVGSLWAIVFPQDGSAPTFEKKFNYKDKAGNAYQWSALHTFTGAKPLPVATGVTEWWVSFVTFGGRIIVSVTGRDIASSSFVYTETKPNKKGAIKLLKIPSAPISVSGATDDGAPIYVGVRRIGWNGVAGGSFFTTLTLNAAVGDKSEVTLHGLGWIPGLIDGLNNQTVLQPTFTTALNSPTSLSYAATIPATEDDREPCALKWVYASSPRTAEATGGTLIDYGPAVTGYVEDIAEPSFAGDGAAGSKSALNSLTFSRAALDTIAAANNTSWRSDLQAYSPATWVTGNYVEGPPGTLTQQSETTRIQGYLLRPQNNYDEFESGTITRQLQDPSVRLQDPAGFIDTRYKPLDFLTDLVNGPSIYGVDAVKYILGQAIDPNLPAGLLCHMPSDWYPLFDIDALVLGQGKLPANDLPLWSPPYGQYAETWLKEICQFDFACLYFAGTVPIYGQFNLVTAGCPTWDIYDGADASGNPVSGSLPDAQQPWTCVKGETFFDTNYDFNRFVVWGSAPGGVVGGTDGKPLGAPLITSNATDFARVSQSWERTDLAQGGKFFEQSYADRYAAFILSQQGGDKAASHYKVTLPFAKPEVFWGHKLRFHTASLPEINGKVLRVLKMTTTGTNDGETGRKASTEFTLVELLPGES